MDPALGAGPPLDGGEQVMSNPEWSNYNTVSHRWLYELKSFLEVLSTSSISKLAKLQAKRLLEDWPKDLS